MQTGMPTTALYLGTWNEVTKFRLGLFECHFCTPWNLLQLLKNIFFFSANQELGKN